MRETAYGKYGALGLILLFVTSLPAGIARAQNSPQALFDRANSHLQSGEYRQALEIYRSLENSERISGSLYLNMAISYVQLDSLGRAKYYFLKSRKFDEVRDKAEEGLEYVESKFSRQSAILPKLPWERFFDWLGDAVGPTLLLGIGIILLNLGIFTFVAGWFIESDNRYYRFGGLGAVVTGLLIIGSSFYVQYLLNRYSQAVMVHQQANVLEQPSDSAAVVSQAFEGYTFTIDRIRSRDQNGWSYVRMSNGLYGWIPDSEIMVL